MRGCEYRQWLVADEYLSMIALVIRKHSVIVLEWRANGWYSIVSRLFYSF